MTEGPVNWCRQPMPWQDQSGPEGDIVLGTEAAVGRGLWSFPFPGRATEVERRTIQGEVFRRLEGEEALRDSQRLSLEDQEPGIRRCLLEKGLVVSESAHRPCGVGVVLERGLARVVVINEEDHLRLKAWCPGFAPAAAKDSALALERILDGRLEFAFNEEIGYLTACPTRVGTGLRLTSLLHLPGLVMAGEINRIVNAMRQLQFSVRGLGGQDKTVRGNLFLISSLVTLGRSEQETAEDFALHVGKIIMHERSARQQLLDADSLGLEDLVHRSRSLVSGARLMSLHEGFVRLSDLRLGLSLGIIEGLSFADLNGLLIRQQGAHLQHAVGMPLPGQDLMRARADLFREVLAP